MNKEALYIHIYRWIYFTTNYERYRYVFDERHRTVVCCDIYLSLSLLRFSLLPFILRNATRALHESIYRILGVYIYPESLYIVY